MEVCLEKRTTVKASLKHETSRHKLSRRQYTRFWVHRNDMGILTAGRLI